MALLEAMKVFVFSLFSEYSTPRFVQIRNKKVAIINRFIQLVILGYTVGYGIFYCRGYQEFDSVVGAVTTKVKGITFVNNSLRSRILDPAEYVIPPQEATSFFVMTKVIPTFRQTEKECPETIENKEAHCQNDTQCEKLMNIFPIRASGPYTGRCVDANPPGQQKVCEVYSWCPVEDDGPGNAIIFPNASDFTVFIKNMIQFPKFRISRRNVLDIYKNNEELSSCRWKPDDPEDKYCPIFVIGDIVRLAGANFKTLERNGGAIQIFINWNCDLDYGEDACLPNYYFSHLDKGNYSAAVGFNFRFAQHFDMKGDNDKVISYRNLFKAYGLRFLVILDGEAGRFSLVNLMFNLGSGVALLGMSTVVCDFIVLYVAKARKLYKKVKIMDIKEELLVQECNDETEKNKVKRCDSVSNLIQEEEITS